MSADADRILPRRFWLVRHHDVSGPSGSGIVAEGTLWSSGQVALHWPGRPLCTSNWVSLDDLLAVHGYSGRIAVEWIDKSTDWPEDAECDQGPPAVEYVNGAIYLH